MAKTGHYECDLCKQLKDPRGVGWELQPHDVLIKIGGGGIQIEEKHPTVCYECARAMRDAVSEAICQIRKALLK